MGRERWPNICLREEMRSIVNGMPSKWGKEVMRALKKMEIEDLPEKILREVALEEITETIKKGLDNFWKIELDNEDEAINKSSYNPIHKHLKMNETDDFYWEDEEAKGKDKEMWAKLRCGNIGRSGKKGQLNWNCRLCDKGQETIMHLLRCEQAIEMQEEEIKEYVREWDMDIDECAMIGEVINLLNGRINIKICEFFRVTERLLQEKTENSSEPTQSIAV